jgi:hypothetical protein
MYEGVSKKFKHIESPSNIRTTYKTPLRNSLLKTRLERDQQKTAECIYSILSKCDRSYSGETGRLLAMRLYEHRSNQKRRSSRNIKLAQHV